MAEAPSPATTTPELPTIIIDPSIYEPERSERPQTTYANFIRLTRVTLALTAVGGATFGVARTLGLDSFLPNAQVAGLTDVLSKLTATPGESAAATHADVIAPTRILPQPSPPSPTISAAHPDTEAALAVPVPIVDTLPAHVDESPSAPAPVPEAAGAEEVRDSVASAKARPAVAPSGVNQTRLSVPFFPDKAAKKVPNVQAELRNARRLLALNQLEAAEAAYRRVLAEDETEQAALTGLARVQLALGQLELALASAKRAVDQAPEATGARLALGDVLRARGDRKAAQVHYDRAAQPKPDND